MALVVPWFVAFPVAYIRYTLWKCPRCGKSFAYSWAVHELGVLREEMRSLVGLRKERLQKLHVRAFEKI
jgi:hypothetical protein